MGEYRRAVCARLVQVCARKSSKHVRKTVPKEELSISWRLRRNHHKLCGACNSRMKHLHISQVFLGNTSRRRNALYTELRHRSKGHTNITIDHTDCGENVALLIRKQHQ